MRFRKLRNHRPPALGKSREQENEQKLYGKTCERLCIDGRSSLTICARSRAVATSEGRPVSPSCCDSRPFTACVCSLCGRSHTTDTLQLCRCSKATAVSKAKRHQQALLSRICNGIPWKKTSHTRDTPSVTTQKLSKVRLLRPWWPCFAKPTALSSHVPSNI